MKIRINGDCFESWKDMENRVDDHIYVFLWQWLNKKPYMIAHTSGSTGTPKKMRLSKEDMRASARVTNDFFGINENSVLLLCLSVSYIAGMMMLVRALEAGAVLATTLPSSHPMADIDDTKKPIDLAAMVPMQVEETLNCAKEASRFPIIRQLMIGGAPVSPKLEKRLKAYPIECYATYGMTETLSHVALRKLNCDNEYLAVGDITFSIDERGCLVIHTPHLQGGPFITNDLVKLSTPRSFVWFGRYDHVINSGGIKYFPETIERKLSACIPERFFITSMPDERLGQRIVLAIEGRVPDDLRLKALSCDIRGYLQQYEVPREIFYCPRFRETTSGKVIREIPDNHDVERIMNR